MSTSVISSARARSTSPPPVTCARRAAFPPSAFSLSNAVEVRAGTWHVFVRNGSGEAADRTAELAVVHERGFQAVATELLANVGVDAGVAGVFDRKCPHLDMNLPSIEGVVFGLGACAHSGYGDGVYPVFAGRTQGQITKLRLAFLAECGTSDATVPARASKPYAASATFVLGDTIEHPKFGSGAVVRTDGNKIDVDFDGERRTLIHGKR